ncbi:MAG: DUF4062 domain-containing protein, partial [Planctomycetota bacterium]
MTKTASLFISAVTSEFGAYRKSLRKAVETSELRVESQESFLDQGVPKLVEISNYIRDCDGVAHLLGEQSGSLATEAN